MTTATTSRSRAGEWKAAGAVVAIVAIAIVHGFALFLVSSLVWTVFLFSTTMMGECSFDEVHCSSLGEFMSDYGVFFYLVLVPASVVLARAIVRRRGGAASEGKARASLAAE